ncbi:MAG: hypothetical protein H6736_13315 [Alphaproteobacteria bacterium]|nr:hypothetical protein [Alphaproteobacteria bacterium]
MRDEGYDSEPLVVAGSTLLTLVCLVFLAPAIWTTTLLPGSPSTQIAFQEIVRSGKSSSIHSYIVVGGAEYECWGSRGREGTAVLYDPSSPSRCREARHTWTLVGGERLGLAGFLLGLAGLCYGIVSFFFLSGDRKRR